VRVTRYLETTPHNLVQGPYTTDGVAFTDHVEVVIILNLSPSEVISFADEVQGYRVLLAAFSDTLSFEEPEVSGVKEGLTNIHDLIVFTGALQVTWIDVEEPADSVSFVDASSYTIVRSDFTNPETLTFSDLSLYSAIFLGAPSDTLTLSDLFEVTRIRGLASISDSIVFSDAMEWDHYGFAAFSDTLVFSDGVVGTLVLQASASDTVAFDDGDLLFTGVWQGHFDETLTFTDAMSAVWIHGTADTLTFSDIVSAENTSGSVQLPAQLPFQLGKA
jgi:hypothetical protein